MKNKSQKPIRALILVLSVCTIFSGLLFSGAFKSIRAYDDGYYDSYYGECTEAVMAERAKWDADGDGKIGLAEAIQALKTVAGE